MKKPVMQERGAASLCQHIPLGPTSVFCEDPKLSDICRIYSVRVTGRKVQLARYVFHVEWRGTKGIALHGHSWMMPGHEQSQAGQPELMLTQHTIVTIRKADIFLSRKKKGEV